MSRLETVRGAEAWAAQCDPDDVEKLAELAPTDTEQAAHAAIKIRTLALVGGTHALALLARFATTSSLAGQHEDTFADDVGHALRFAWTRFDRKLSAEAVFGAHDELVITDGPPFVTTLEGIEAACLASLQCVAEPDCDFRPLGRCAELRKLLLRMPDGHADLSSLAACEQIEELDISGNELDDQLVALLPQLPNLTRLRVSFHEFGPLSCLLELPQLQSLQLGVAPPWLVGPPPVDDREIPDEQAQVLRSLAMRGVLLRLWGHQHWTERADQIFPRDAADGQFFVVGSGRLRVVYKKR